MSSDYNRLRDVLRDHDLGYFRSYGDLGRAIETLAAALRRRDKTIRALRKPSPVTPSGDTMSDATEHDWEYGFYDSHPDGDWTAAQMVQTNPTIWWYVFGFPFTTPESADRSGRKSAYGTPVIVRRHLGSSEWEHVTEPTEQATPDLGTTEPKAKD